MTEIPTAPDQLTPQWIETALREAGVLTSGRVRGCDIEIIGEGVGILGVLARLRLDIDGDDSAPRSIVAKFPAAAPDNRQIADSLGFYQTEVSFYQTIGASSGIKVPQCYAAVQGGSSDEFVLLLEDLGSLRPADQVAGIGRDDLFAATQALAKFHAAWWEHPRFDSDLKWINSAGSPAWMETFNLLYAGAWEAGSETFRDRLPPRVFATLNSFLSHQPGLMRRVAQRPHTLNHGDFRSDNFFFDDADARDPFRVLDWQVMIVGVGPHDLAYLLSTSVAPALRRTEEDAVLRAYHDGLLAGGITGYSFEDCWDDYLHALAWRACSTLVIVVGTLDMSNERGEALEAAFMERFLAVYEDHDLGAIVARF